MLSLIQMAEQPRSELELSRLVEAELVRAAQEGSASALRLIVRRHNQRLYRVARAIVRDDTEAEDVLQEAYLSAFRNLAKLPCRRKPFDLVDAHRRQQGDQSPSSRGHGGSIGRARQARLDSS